MLYKNFESLRVKTYFFNYYVKRNLLLKENISQLSTSVDFMMQVSMEEFSIVNYIYSYLFKRRPIKFLKKEKYGQKQEKMPLKLKFSNKQFFYFLFFFRYWFSCLASKNKQLYMYKSYEHKISCTFMELSILLKNVSFTKVIDLYGLLSELVIDIYINNNGPLNFSSYYSFFRYTI